MFWFLLFAAFLLRLQILYLILILFILLQFVFVLMVMSWDVLGRRQLRHEYENSRRAKTRDGKSLLNTFPFNAQASEDHHHQDHEVVNSVKERMRRHQVLKMLLEQILEMMARNVLTKLRWWSR